MCKPHKMKKANRWTKRDQTLLKEFEKEKSDNTIGVE